MSFMKMLNKRGARIDPFAEIAIYIYPLKSFRQIALNKFYRSERKTIRI